MSKTIVSIDLWGTLIKASPSFKEEKYKLVNDIFRSIPIKEIEQAFLTVKQRMDNLVESTGFQPDIDTLWVLLIREFYPEYDNLTESANDILWELKTEYAHLAMKHMPSLYDEYVVQTLEEMSNHYQLVLSSNTLFMQGYVLRRILERLEIAKYFTKMNFSDELRVAKPHPLMYSNSKYHIGDNPITDGEGARRAGSISFSINRYGSEDNLQSVWNFLKLENKYETIST